MKKESITYYEEMVLDGFLCHRLPPDGLWIAFTPKELTEPRAVGEFKGWQLFDEMPEGYKPHPAAGSPLYGYEFISRGSPLNGNKLALCKIKRVAIVQEPGKKEVQKVEQPVKKEPVPFDPAVPRALNELARKQSIQMILKDILLDLAICEIEGWGKMEYINELKREICRIGTREDIVIEPNDNAQQSVHLTAFGAGGRGQNPLQLSFIADDPSATNGGR